MQRMPAVSRPAWALALTGAGGRSGAPRKNPIEIVATMGSYVTRTQAAEFTGLRAGPFGRWADGVNAMREDCAAFARHWDDHNDQVAAEDGPLWVVLGDSTAQGLGAPGPHGGYVGQTLSQLRRTTGRHWQVINLAVSGSLIRDVLAEQIPQLADEANQADLPDLVTCGTGVNDILFSAPAKLFADMRTLLAAVPDQTVMLDLPLPAGFWWIVGRVSVPYITRINRVIHEVAAERGLPVAEVSSQFTAPWAGKFASDNFHPSQDGYRDWTRALLAALPGQHEQAVPGQRAFPK